MIRRLQAWALGVVMTWLVIKPIEGCDSECCTRCQREERRA